MAYAHITLETMRAILTFNDQKKATVEIVSLPNKPMSAAQIERDIMDKFNVNMTERKVVKVHLLRN